LCQKALHPRFDKGLAELVEVKEADQQGEQAGKVEDDDAARQA
jgi:hypothetical protein